MTVQELCEAIFDVSAILPSLEVGELKGRWSDIGSAREKRGLTDRKAAGRCSSAQNSSGVSSATE